MRDRLVIQKTNSDCGLACVAMICETPYEKVLDKFMELGLYAKHKKALPYSTNFKDVNIVLASLGFEGKVQRFKNWDDISKPSIIKIPNNRKYSWHWVVAVPSDKHKVVIYDPSFQLLSYLENPPLDEAYIHPDNFSPYGSFISCSKNLKYL
jgi:ABC-type bacteriocin/lantibiotic exporter with double-glycine peptidase domain